MKVEIAAPKKAPAGGANANDENEPNESVFLGARALVNRALASARERVLGAKRVLVPGPSTFVLCSSM